MSKLTSAIFLVCLLLFGVLASLVAGNTTLPVDTATLTWVNSHASEEFDSIFKFITNLAGWLIVSLVTLTLTLLLVLKKQYLNAIFVAASVSGAAVSGFVLKAVFERPRPDLWQWLIVETNFSFPSGHATASCALALCGIILVWRTKWRWLALAAGTAYIIAIGLSRLYLGVHFPTDILGGWLLSAAWVVLVKSCIDFYIKDNHKGSLL